MAPNKYFNDSSDYNSVNGSPLEVYLRGERAFSVVIVEQIASDLQNTDSDVSKQLASDETPDSWLSLWPNGPQSGDRFVRLTAHISRELSRQSSRSGAQLDFDLSHLFHPNSLVNALKQEASRTLNTSVDQLKTRSAWGRHTLTDAGISQSMRVTINGIGIEGALFDEQLKDCSPDSPLQSPMPVLNLYFMPKVGIVYERTLPIARKTIARKLVARNAVTRNILLHKLVQAQALDSRGCR